MIFALKLWLTIYMESIARSTLIIKSEVFVYTLRAKLETALVVGAVERL